MNFVGKIFIVLILLMSLLWMGFSVAVYATHKNWRELVMNETAAPGKPRGLLHQLNDANQRVQELKEQKERLQDQVDTEKQSKRQTLAKLENEKEELQNELDQEKQRLAEEVDKSSEAIAALDATNDRLDAMMKELVTLRDEIRKAEDERDQNMQQVVELTDKLHQESLKYRSLETTSERLKADLAETKVRLRLSGLPVPPEPWIDTPAPPGLDGLVLAVGEGNIEINLGTDDGLRPGHFLNVKRGVDFVGRVEVVRAWPDRVVAKIDRAMQRQPIQRGDRVYTYTNGNTKLSAR
jgi:hypothetical protein